MSRPACWSTIFGWKLVSSHSSIWFVICQIQAHFQKLLNNIFSSKVGIGRRRLKHGIGIGRRIVYYLLLLYSKGIGRRIKRKPSISRSLDLETSPSSSEISKVKPRYEKQLQETNCIYSFYTQSISLYLNLWQSYNLFHGY